MTGIIFDIKEFAVFDGPGIRTTVFMKGCPLRCAWCHNPEGLKPEPEIMVSRAACVRCGACEKVCSHPDSCIACGACVPVCRGGLRRIVGEKWTAEALAARLMKDTDLYKSSGGGVTFSGGEPLLQWPFVANTIRLMDGVHTAIETSGCCPGDVFADMLETVSLVMMDWKVTDPDKHLRYTGVKQDRIRDNLARLCVGETPFIIRLPVIPGVNDSAEHFGAVACMLKGAKKLIRVEILPYQKTAGAKYEMVGRDWKPEFEDEKLPEIYTEAFEEAGIPLFEFR